MKIGVFLGELSASAGGAFTFQESLIDALLDFKSNHEYIFFHYGERAPSLKKANNKIVQLTHRKPETLNNLFHKPYILEQALIDEGIHVAWFAIQDYEQVQCPYLYTIWDLQHRTQPFFPEFFNTALDYQKRESHKEFIRRSTGLIVPNQVAVVEAQLFYGVPKERIISAHHPTPPFIYSTKADHSLAPKNPFILYPAQFWAHKNHMVIVEAAKYLDEKLGYKLDFVFTGVDKYNQSHVMKRMDDLGVRSRFHMPGLVSLEHLAGLYEKAAALIYPSLFGPENLPPLEAMVKGLPAVVSDVPGAKEQYQEAALYFDPLSENDLAEKVYSVLTNEPLRQQLIAAGKSLSQSRSATEYVRIIDNYLSRFEKIRRNWP